jgi:hypothetical protein
MIDDSIREELAQFDEHFGPRRAPTGESKELKTLDDGDYEFTVTGGELTRTPKTKELIFRLGLRVDGGAFHGVEVEKVTFFKSQTSVDILGWDLRTLGFDTDKWRPAHGRTFTEELVKVLPQLPGIRLAGTKTTKNNYANLRIKQRLA